MGEGEPIVLVVDDEPVLLRLLEINLRAAGLDVRTASNGAEALRRASTETPDAVVVDLGLPDMDGGEVIARLRDLEALAATPVVVLSGLDADELAGRGYAADVHAFLTKPVEPADLVDVVRRALARTDG
jgi:two-component system KDP operon response regulator KdpE